MAFENAFELAASAIRFGRGVTREIGMDLAELSAKKVMVLTDARLAKLQPVATVTQSLRDNRIEYALFDRVHTGKGRRLKVAMQDSVMHYSRGGFITQARTGKAAPRRPDSRRPRTIAPLL